ncbi:MAG: ABC transporter permease [Acidimicrobiales bacterium]
MTLPTVPIEQKPHPVVTTSHLSLVDLFNEALTALTARPARTLLTALGTILGVAALVATLGLAKTAGNQIVGRFDELAATRVTITPDTRGFGQQQRQISVIPWDAGDRLNRLNGVVAAGTKSDVEVGNRLARAVPVIDPLGQTEFQIPVIAVSAGTLDAVRSTLATGRTFDKGHNDRADNVAVLGPSAAQRLGVTRVDNLPAIFIGDQPFAVVGILESTAREPDLLSAIIIPDQTARLLYGLTAPSSVHVDVAVGAAELIGTQAAIALSPNQPDLLQVRVPPSPRGVQSDVQDDVNALFLLLGAISLLVGAIGIANVTLVSVLERTGEIGLRRALGATPTQIAVQFLTESATLGALSGLIGTSLGVLTTVAISATREWTPVLDTWLPLVAPILGAAIGLLAGLYPSLKAARMQPVTALRSF